MAMDRGLLDTFAERKVTGDARNHVSARKLVDAVADSVVRYTRSNTSSVQGPSHIDSCLKEVHIQHKPSLKLS